MVIRTQTPLQLYNVEHNIIYSVIRSRFEMLQAINIHNFFFIHCAKRTV